MADTKISALAAASSVAAANEFAINEAGTSKKVTAAQIANYVFTAGVYASGTWSLTTGRYVQMVNHLILTTTERVTLAGTARLRIV